MKEYYGLFDGHLVTATGPSQIVVYTKPSDEEKQELLRTLGLDQHALESALDPDEISRIEFTPEYLYIIWKTPNTASFKQMMKFEVSSVGIFVKNNVLTLILAQDSVSLTAKEFQKVESLTEFILKFFLHTIHHFLGHLKAMRLLNAELQAKLNESMENRYLLQMFNLSESLIYYLNALESNASVLAKLRLNCEKIAYSKRELEILDDIIIEHQQCSRQTEIYSSVLSDLMDARGNIINNNMNILLRNLTLINVVFLPLNLIAGIGGMSEYTRLTESFINWKIAYALLLGGMLIVGIITWVVLLKKLIRQKVVKVKAA